MEMAFIEPESLAAVRGRLLFYPTAGSDWNELLLQFADYIDVFHFCDINYNDLARLENPFSDPGSYELIDSKIEGEIFARIDAPTQSRPYPDLAPGRLSEIYRRVSDGRRLTVVRRRGYGQYALAELPNRSLGIFVHRGDSQGEGGSNVYFLANKKRDHEPVSNLFDKLSRILADPAIVISDGSNAKPNFLKKFHRSQTSGAEAYNDLHKLSFHFGQLDWKCVGYISNLYGPTLVWRVTRQPLSLN
jgi:hypothetical protein